MKLVNVTSNPVSEAGFKLNFEMVGKQLGLSLAQLSLNILVLSW
jgi:hypothetical protein